MIDGIIFDLDGTLWDCCEQVTVSWNETFERLGLERRITEVELEGCMGLMPGDIAKKLLPDLEDEAAGAAIDQCLKDECVYLRGTGGLVYEGVEETLKTLNEQLPLFIVSNCVDGYIEACFEYHGIGEFFRDYEHQGKTGLNKAENIKRIVARYELEHAVYVGDTALDYASCQQAGIDFVFAAYGFGQVDEAAVKINSFSELLNYVEKNIK